MFEEDFSGRILPFDSGAAIHYAEKVAASESAGGQIDIADAQIVATCIQHEAVLAPRNIKGFGALSVETITWEMGGYR
ncbi:hypothetical protein [Modicisalibacter sp. MOD 31.J]|uniref:hypothetical protein n=2 Tax=unclassified Modicisalibacter TaxID=2679913 RepID=UPI001CCBF2C7|nr:hypothetical protein [Modicisalibacter sp. MOD 31.J]MBZ9573320.1 hypothetical protein [Modicisalibacter sp. MOD 31.J]